MSHFDDLAHAIHSRRYARDVVEHGWHNVLTVPWWFVEHDEDLRDIRGLAQAGKRDDAAPLMHHRIDP